MRAPAAVAGGDARLACVENAQLHAVRIKKKRQKNNNNNNDELMVEEDTWPRLNPVLESGIIFF